MKRCRQDKIFIFFNYVLATFFLLIMIYPLYYILIASISNPDALMAGQVILYPIDITLEGYQALLEHKEILTGYANTVFYTVTGTLLSLYVTVPMGYVLSRNTLPFRKFLSKYCLLTMFVGGGMIPTYLNIRSLNLLDTRWIMILLGCASVWNMILCRNFFMTNIPDGIIEAAKMDGCSEIGIFTRVVLPLSKPILAVMTLYFGVSHWNSYMNALIYINDEKKWPLQLFIRNILSVANNINPENIADSIEKLKQLEVMKYGLLVVATVPMLILYPFVQKYFVQGVTVGSVKE